MRSTARPLLILHPDRGVRTRIRSAAPDRFHAEDAADWRELRNRVASAPPAAVVVVDPGFTAGSLEAQVAGELEDLLRSFPSATIVAALDATPDAHERLRVLGDWGIAEIIQLDDDRTGPAIRRRLLSARAQPMRRLLSDHEALQLTGRGRAILEAAVETVLQGGLPRDLADALGFSPSTLLRWCERSQLPNPRRLILWLRVIFAAALLDDPGHSVESVGVACGYSGDQALRRAIRAVLPMTPTELRERGAFETASRAFFAEVASLADLDADRR